MKSRRWWLKQRVLLEAETVIWLITEILWTQVQRSWKRWWDWRERRRLDLYLDYHQPVECSFCGIDADCRFPSDPLAHGWYP